MTNILSKTISKLGLTDEETIEFVRIYKELRDIHVDYEEPTRRELDIYEIRIVFLSAMLNRLNCWFTIDDICDMTDVPLVHRRTIRRFVNNVGLFLKRRGEKMMGKVGKRIRKPTGRPKDLYRVDPKLLTWNYKKNKCLSKEERSIIAKFNKFSKRTRLDKIMSDKIVIVLSKTNFADEIKGYKDNILTPIKKGVSNYGTNENDLQRKLILDTILKVIDKLSKEIDKGLKNIKKSKL